MLTEKRRRKRAIVALVEAPVSTKADIAFLLEKFANRVWIQYDSGRSFICTRYNHPRPDAQIENACDFMEKV